MISPRRDTARVQIERVHDGVRDARSSRDVLAVEEPMEIRIETADAGEHRVAVTMRTPGDDFELAAGFLFSEGLLTAREDLVELRYCGNVDPQEYNIVTAKLRPGARFDPDDLDRNFYTTSSCGVCGKASLEAVEIRGCERLPLAPESVAATDLAAMPERLRAGQRVFDRTGGLHAAGLFDPDGELVVLREDVGRHNAVDKAIGNRFLAGALPLERHVLVVSGRASFEILQKALMAGIPVLVAVGAPSSLAVDVARRFGITLVGFARDDGFNVYTEPGRIRFESS